MTNLHTKFDFQPLNPFNNYIGSHFVEEIQQLLQRKFKYMTV